MPQTKYTNADLKRFERRPLGVTIERGRNRETDTPEPEGVDVEQLLANAKGTLARANRLSNEQARDFADIDAAQGDAPGDQPSVTDSAATQLARLARRVARPIPQAAEKAAFVGSLLAPEVAIPSQAIIAAMSGKRLLSGESEGALDTGLNMLGLVGGGSAALKGLQSLVGARQAAQAGRAARAAAAGAGAENRYLARQLGDKGYASGAVQKIVGMTPEKARSFSSAKPISANDIDISGLMDEAWPGRYVRGGQGSAGSGSAPSGPLQGLLDALDSRVSGVAPKSDALGELGGGLGRGGPTIRGSALTGGAEPNTTAVGRYAQEGGGFMEMMKRLAEREGMSVTDYLQKLREGGDAAADFVMPSANLPRIR